MEKHSEGPKNIEVSTVFNSYPTEMRSKLMYLRSLIYETAAALNEVEGIDETLKWGEPSYLTSKNKIGSTIRIAWKPSNPNQYSIFFKCTANLVPAFKEKFPDKFKFGGDRSIYFNLNDLVPVNELKQCIGLALTYHKNKTLEVTDRWRMVENVT